MEDDGDNLTQAELDDFYELMAERLRPYFAHLGLNVAIEAMDAEARASVRSFPPNKANPARTPLLPRSLARDIARNPRAAWDLMFKTPALMRANDYLAGRAATLGSITAMVQKIELPETWQPVDEWVTETKLGGV